MVHNEVPYHCFLECIGVCTDTRSIQAGSMFFALKGPSFDANAFAADALEKGARYAVVDDPTVVKSDRFILVGNVLLALQHLARFHRRQFDIPVIGITGTNGKTTTKELVHAVLNAAFETLATTGNLNNHIGVPLTLLRLSEQHRYAIIEMGANKPGDIEELANIAEPTHALITNIGKAHLEGFGSFDGVLRTKTELYRSLQERKGLAFVHADDPLLMEHSKMLQRYTYGTGAHADVRGEAMKSGPFLSIEFNGTEGGHLHADLQLIGTYNLPNALAAVAIGRYFGVRDEIIVQALTSYRPSNSRSQFLDTGRNQLVLDAYNANPTSMAAALENFAGMSSSKPKLAILGDMLELGGTSRAEHRAIVDMARNLGMDVIFVGEQFASAGAAPDMVHSDAETLLQVLERSPLTGRLILLKASRGTKLEKLVPAL